MEWVHRSADVWTYVPDWLKEALAQEKITGVKEILRKAANSLDAEISAAVAEGDVQKAQGAVGERANLTQAEEAFREIASLVGLGEQEPELVLQAVPGTSSPPIAVQIGNRSGGIGLDILAAAQAVGAPWSRPAVWSELDKMAMNGKGTCLVEVMSAAEGRSASIRYIDGDGEERDLTPKQLAERLVELRKKLRDSGENA